MLECDWKRDQANADRVLSYTRFSRGLMQTRPFNCEILKDIVIL
jgi:hypothetical protein